MSPPRSKLKGNSESSASGVQPRKRKNSETDDIYALMNKIDALNSVCNNTYKVVDELKAIVENLLAENICIKSELRKLQDLHVTTSANSEKGYSETVVQLKKLNSTTALTNTASYAAVVNNNPVVVIKPKDSTQASSTTKKDLRENLSPSTTNFCGVRNAANGGVVIECKSVSGSNSLLKDATDKLGSNYVVTMPSKRPTKIRVVGMSENVSSEQLKDKIRAQNPEFFNSDSVLEVVSTFKIKDYFGAKLVIDPETFRKMMDDSKLRIGWDVCRIYEAFDIVRCFNCSSFHHMSKNCTSKKRCPKCSGEHTLLECKSALETCCNCSDAAKSLKLVLDTNHSAMSPDCPVYVRKINTQRQRTNYIN